MTQAAQLLIGDVFRNAARAVPDRVAVALDDDVLTFGELDAGGNRMAHALQALGVGHGARVVVPGRTSFDLVRLFVAAAKLGAVFVPANPALGAQELEDVVAVARPALLVGDAEWETLTSGADAREVDAPGLNERDPHVVFFTSGSAGRPKGAVLSHRVNYLRTHPGALLEPRGAMVCPYPLFHMGAWTIALQQWQARDRVVLLAAPDAAAICDAVERHHATRLNCIPAVWRRLLDHLGGGTLPSLRFADTGTSATPVELLGAVSAAAPGATVRVFYGSTEAGGVAVLEHADLHRKPGSCGVPAPSTELRIDAGGELWARGPLLFDGYLNDAEATAAALVDGWYRTGDLAERDDEGYLTIVGRARDVIRTGGETVAPVEVEAALGDHPAVADVAVVALPDAEWGEIVCAVVVATGVAPSLEELRAHCAERLAGFKHPRRLVVVDAIPRTASTHQVQRRLLVERLQSTAL